MCDKSNIHINNYMQSFKHYISELSKDAQAKFGDVLFGENPMYGEPWEKNTPHGRNNPFHNDIN